MDKTADGRPDLQPHGEEFSVFRRCLQREFLSRKHPALVDTDAAFNPGQAPLCPEFCPGGNAKEKKGQHREIPLAVEQGHEEKQTDNDQHDGDEEKAWQAALSGIHRGPSSAGSGHRNPTDDLFEKGFLDLTPQPLLFLQDQAVRKDGHRQ